MKKFHINTEREYFDKLKYRIVDYFMKAFKREFIAKTVF